MSDNPVIHPTSYAQRRFWLLDQLTPDNRVYNICGATRFSYPVQAGVLEASLEELVRRHESLRTTFRVINGRPVQVVAGHSKVRIESVDLRGLPPAAREAEASRLIEQEAARNFDLSEGPLLATKLLRLRDEDFIFVLTMHHIVSDGWSMVVFWDEFSELWAAIDAGEPSPLPALELQYADFATWQRERLSGEEGRTQLAYWKKQLADLTDLQLPTDRPRPAASSYGGATHTLAVPGELYSRLCALSRQENVTMFMLLLGAFQALLCRYTAQEDIAVGVPIANRSRADTIRTIGCFVNSLVLRIDLSGDPCFRDLLARVRATALDAYANQETPFEKLVEELRPERDANRNPLFQVSFQLFADSDAGQDSSAGVEQLDIARTSTDIDIALDLWESSQGLSGTLVYSTDLFDADTINRLTEHFLALLEGVTNDPGLRVSELPVLTEAERTQVLFEWTDTSLEYPEHVCVHQLFEAQAERTPDAVAVSHLGREVTYASLNEKADRLARRLVRFGVVPDTLVAICAHRSVDMIVAVLGVLKAGGAYIPLDPNYPRERLSFMLEDARPLLVLCQEDTLAAIAAYEGKRLCLDTELERSRGAASASKHRVATSSSQLAYLIYTSGSSGTPKGVLVTHRSVCHHLLAMQAALPLRQSDRVPQKYSFSFDVSVLEIFGPLIVGARLIIAGDDDYPDSARFVAFLKSERITVLDLVPSQLRVLLIEDGFRSCQELRRIVCGGEALLPELRDRVFDVLDVELHNVYGPTEATIGATFWTCPPDDESAVVPIGKALGSTRLYVLDANLNPTPIGVPGELHVGGDGVAKGYLNRPQLTAEKFIRDPFRPDPESRLYKTGDLVRYRPDGNIEFLGRIDEQVKVRGFRVEPGEIETTLIGHPGVESCAVIASDEDAGESRLLAYVVPFDDEVEVWPSIGEYLIYDELMYYAMTYDEGRNAAYRAAIERLVRDKIVVDLGTGADAVLARLCVDAGAKLVYAVDVLEESVTKARALVDSLGLSEKIVVVHGDSTSVELPEAVDICVSELIGMIGSSEGMSVILNDARRFLKKSGRMIPRRVTTLIAAVSLPDELICRPRFTETSRHYVEAAFQTVGRPFDLRVCIKNLPREHFLSEPGVFEDLDFIDAVDAEFESEIRLTIVKPSSLQGFLLWLNIETIEGELFDGLVGRHNWLPVFFPAFHPGLDVEAGDEIIATCTCVLGEDSIKPDYGIRGCIRKRDGTTEAFDYQSPYCSDGFQATSFYRVLFADSLTRDAAEYGLSELAKDCVQRWQESWDEAFRRSASGLDPTFNTTGWNDADGSPIPADEMREQVAHTAANVKRLRPRRVLDIGCGAGLLLRRVAPDCDRYVGTDISSAALEYLRGAGEDRLPPNVELLNRGAEDLGSFERGDFDTVVLNSVVQYFPNLDYLQLVIESAVSILGPAGHVYIGDVRNMAMLEALHASVELENAKEAMSVDELKARISRRVSREDELFVDPGFFIGLRGGLAGVTAVDIQPKRGWYRNERTRFRYDVVLTIGGSGPSEIDAGCLPWSRVDNLVALRHTIMEDEPEALVVRGVPDARVQRPLRMMELLKGRASSWTVEELRAALDKPERVGIELEAIWGLADELPYEIAIGYSGADSPGSVDIALVRRGQGDPRLLVTTGSGPGELAVPVGPIANNPLKTHGGRDLVPKLRTYLESRLPAHMLPSDVLLVPALPLAPTGKVDKRALPSPELLRPKAQMAYEQARTPTEELLVKIWEDVLGLKYVSIHDNFFTDLGGHSLLGTQLMSRVREAFQLDLSLRFLFEHPTVAMAATVIDEVIAGVDGGDSQGPGQLRSLKGGGIIPTKRLQGEFRSRGSIETIPRRADSSPARLSFAQERLWFLDQLVPGNTFYNESEAVRIDFEVDVDVLRRALREIVQRHESLRTTFKARGGIAYQVVDAATEPDLAVSDLRRLPAHKRETEARRLTQRHAERSFDLAEGPLIRTALLRIDDHDSILVVTTHHIVCDGWSMGLFWDELFVLWESFERGEPPALTELRIQYSDFAEWQRGWLQGENLHTQLLYWRTQLADLPTLELPTDFPRPAVQSFRGASEPVAVSLSLTKKLNALSQREGVTLFMTLLAAFQTLLYRYTGQVDIVTGSYIANRNRAEVEDLIGFFVNALVLRTDLGEDPTFLELLGRVREVTLEAYTYQDMPFAKLVEELQPDRDLSRNPLFQVAFQLFNAPTIELESEPDTGRRALQPQKHRSAFDLALTLWEGPDGLAGDIEYSTDLFARESIERFVSQFLTLLESIVATTEQRLSELVILGEAERHQLVAKWNDTSVPVPSEKSVVQLFHERALADPSGPAFYYRDQVLTFQELESRSNQLAHYLGKRGVGSDVIVGLCLERSLDAMVAVLGILKAGGAYLPLDPGNPPERLNYMVSDAGVGTLLTHTDHAELFSAHKDAVICLDAERDRIAREPDSAPGKDCPGDSLAYVVYTSGSTGKPKGVAVEHRVLLNRLWWMWRRYPFEPTDVCCLKTTLTFVDSVWEILGPSLEGVPSIIVPDRELPDVRALIELLSRYRVTRIWLVPSLLRLLLDTCPDLQDRLPHLRFWVTTGEALKAELLDRFRQAMGDSRLYNLYGLSEVWDVTWCDVTESRDPLRVPIGRPIDNVSVYILDDHLNPLPIGIRGELYVGGAGLARGYLNNPERTEASFIPNPFDPEPGSRLYRTGDLACFLADGNVQYLGRIDHQVKVRGYRVELGEIESVILEHPHVRDATVLATSEPEGAGGLVAYVTRKDSDAVADGAPNPAQAEQLSQWLEVWDETYSQNRGLGDASLNPSGFRSSYTGLDLPLGEVREWVDQAVVRVLALRPDRLLEIGCGSGLLASRLVTHCSRYVGTDFSPAALRIAESQADATGLGQVSLFHCNADDFGPIDGESFDTIVINSVAQYFPDISYLLSVLRQAVQHLRPGGSIFLGDVLNLALLDAFNVSVALQQAPESMPLEELERRVRTRSAETEMLAIEPAFFYALVGELPRLRHVLIQPKRGRYKNEFSSFRYDVSLYTDIGPGADPPDCLAMDWRADGLSRTKLARILRERSPASLLVTGVPDARLRLELAALDALNSPGHIDTAGQLREHLRNLEDDVIELEDVIELAGASTYSAYPHWSGPGGEECFQLLLRRQDPDHRDRSSAERPPAIPIKTGRRKHWSEYANDPSAELFARRLSPELRRYLHGKLPEYMIPGEIVVLERFPLTPSAKIDRLALPAPGRVRPDLESRYVAPRTNVERKLADMYSEILGIEGLGVHDNFFTELRGHSLLATRLLARVCDAFEIDLPLSAVFEAPTVADLAELVDSTVDRRAVRLASSRSTAE